MAIRLLTLLFLAAVALPALADDVPLPELTPKGKPLVMAFKGEDSSSQCIGDPKTPLCAVETMMACWNRGDHHLCRIGLNYDHEPRYGGGLPHPDDIFLYRVVRREVLTEKTLPWAAFDVLERPGLMAPQEGDLRIDIEDVRCDKEISQETCGYKGKSVAAFIVRREGDRWTVMQWSDL